MEDGQTRGALFKKPVVAAPPNALAAPAALPAARLAVVRTSVSDCQFCAMAAVTPVPSAPAFFPGTAALLAQSPAITAAHPTYKYVTRLPIGSWRASLGPSAPEPRHLGLHRTELLAAKAVASRLGVQVADLERLWFARGGDRGFQLRKHFEGIRSSPGGTREVPGGFPGLLGLQEGRTGFRVLIVGVMSRGRCRQGVSRPQTGQTPYP